MSERRSPQPNREQESQLPGLLRGFLLASVGRLRPLLRPSARNDLARYARNIQSVESAQAFLAWSQRVLEAHMQDAKQRWGGRAAKVVAQTALPIFRRPDRAFRVRWLL
jgi:hypothetical protein